MSSDLEHVKQAILELGLNQEADKFLQTFETTPVAWEVCFLLLSEPSVTTFRFFGAKILYSKVKKDFYQLDATSSQQLKLSLVSKIIQLSNEATLDMRVCRYICLALASLSIKVAEDGIISQILGWLNEIVTTKPLVILELLIVLAEECNDQAGLNETQNFSQQLTSSIDQVLDFLNSLLAYSSVAATTRQQVLKCLAIWADMTEIPAAHLLSKAVYSVALQSLQQLETLEDASEVVVTTLRKYCGRSSENDEERDEDGQISSAGTDHVSIGVIGALVPHVLGTRALWTTHHVDSDSDDDDLNISRAMVRLYTELAEASLMLYLDGKIAEGESELITQLLVCTSLQYSVDIARIPLNYFYQLSQNISFVNGPPQNALVAKYGGFFGSLLMVAHNQLQALDPSSVDSERSRRDWEDAVSKSAQVIGHETCLQEICKLIQSDSSNMSSIESSLSVLRTLGPFISRSEAVYIPWLVGVFPSMWQAPQLKAAIIQFIGSISSWVAGNLSYVSPLMCVLQEALLSSEHELVASKAILDLCKYSPSTVPIAELHVQMLSLRANKLHNLATDLNILETCSIAISALPIPAAEAALGSILEPIGLAILDHTAQIEAGRTDATKLLLDDIEHLTCVFRYASLDVPRGQGLVHPLLTFFRHFAFALQKVVDVSPSFHTHEKVCRFYKYAIRSLGDHFLPCLPPLSAHLVDAFSRHSMSPFLYISSICFSEYGSIVQSKPVLQQLFDALSTALFAKFTSVELFEKSPDVCEEYFFLVSRVLKYCPGMLVVEGDQSRLTRIIQAGIAGLAVPHMDAQRGVLDFFEGLVSIADPSSSLRLKSSSVFDHRVVTTVTDFIPQFAPVLVATLIENITGRIPGFALRLEASSGSISSVLWGLIQADKISSAPNSMQGWLNSSFSALSSNIQEEAVRLKLHEGSLQTLRRQGLVADILWRLHTNIARQQSGMSNQA